MEFFCKRIFVQHLYNYRYAGIRIFKLRTAQIFRKQNVLKEDFKALINWKEKAEKL